MPRMLHTLVAAAAVCALAAPAFADPDKGFLKKAIEGDNSEIQLGKIAEAKSGSREVREYGHMLVMDHSKHKADAMTMGQQAGLKPSDGIAAEAKRESRKLDRLSGPAFDREFASYMVKDHTKDIRDYEKQSRKHDLTAGFARQTLPTLHQHLDTALRLRGHL